MSATERPPHLRFELSQPWSHHGPAVRVTGFLQADWLTRDDAVKGRAALNLNQGSFELSLDPNVADLRGIAALCNALADRMDCEAAAMRAQAQDEAEVCGEVAA